LPGEFDGIKHLDRNTHTYSFTGHVHVHGEATRVGVARLDQAPQGHPCQVLSCPGRVIFLAREGGREGGEVRGGRGDDERICARVVEGLALVRKAVRTRTRRRGSNDAMFMKKKSLRRVVEEEDEEQQLQRQQRRWQGRVERRKDGGGGSKAMATYTKKRRSYLYSFYLMSPSYL